MRGVLHKKLFVCMEECNAKRRFGKTFLDCHYGSIVLQGEEPLNVLAN
jgi:hypothetical protein